MLFHLPYVDDTRFKSLIDTIKIAYYPEDAYIHEEDKLPGMTQTDSDNRLRLIDTALDKIVDHVCHSGSGFYCVHHDEDSSGEKMKIFPFIDRFHHFFLQRKWTYPYLDAQMEAHNIFRLKPPSKKEISKYLGSSKAFINYSKNRGDYNHFVNVVMAVARLIKYFSEPSKLSEILKNDTKQKDYSDLANMMSFNEKPDKRTFNLMLAAFYHDLGKTVDYHRHGMEGATILSNNVIDAVSRFQDILESYNDPSFDRDDLLFISLLVSYHDLFGTLGTGEAGYLRFTDLIHRLQRYSIRQNQDEQKKCGRQYLFDLWMLNLADIMVSLDGRKEELQEEFLEEEGGTARIEKFLNEQKSRALIHDLKVALKLIDAHNSSRHVDDIALLEQDTLTYSKRHTVERIRRLLRCLLVDRGRELRLLFEDSPMVCSIIDKISDFSDAKWNNLISRCIYSEIDYTEFANRFCWIGQMDYAFIFFNKIVERAFDRISKGELAGGNGEQDRINTNWVIRRSGLKKDLLDRTNAEFFVDNYASTVMQILEHILFREQTIDRLRNLEFWVAGQRLTNEKIDRICSLEGPYRARRAIHLALESIFIW